MKIIVAIVSGHAFPCSEDRLERLAGHFADNRVAGVYCRRIPWPDVPWNEMYLFMAAEPAKSSKQC